MVFKSDIVLNSLLSLGNNSDDAGHIISVHFRVVSDGLLPKRVFLNCFKKKVVVLNPEKGYLIFERAKLFKNS